MDDFCVTIPYGLMVLGGGVAGYVKRGSVASLAAGAGFGGALLLAGALSIWAFAGDHSSSLFATADSALVLIFYVYKISNGGNEVYFPVSAE